MALTTEFWIQGKGERVETSSPPPGETRFYKSRLPIVAEDGHHNMFHPNLFQLTLSMYYLF